MKAIVCFLLLVIMLSGCANENVKYDAIAQTAFNEANALYAKKDYDGSIGTLTRFINGYPQAKRGNEALQLRNSIENEKYDSIQKAKEKAKEDEENIKRTSELRKKPDALYQKAVNGNGSENVDYSIAERLNWHGKVPITTFKIIMPNPTKEKVVIAMFALIKERGSGIRIFEFYKKNGEAYFATYYEQTSTLTFLTKDCPGKTITDTSIRYGF